VIAGQRDTLVYLDETGFDLTAARTHGRAPRGQPVYGSRSGNRRPRTSLIGALVKGKLTAPMIFSGTTNTAVFNRWLEEFLLPAIGKGMTLIMDNAIFHKSQTTKDIVHKAGCSILFLPPYSPELNPIEQTWANLKRQRKNNPTQSIHQLIQSSKY
jgi:isftu1 transposase